MKDLETLIIHCDDRYLKIFNTSSDIWQKAFRQVKEKSEMYKITTKI